MQGVPGELLSRLRRQADLVGCTLEELLTQWLEGKASTIRERLDSDSSSSDLWRLILDESPDAIILMNMDRGIRYINPAAEALCGYTHDEITSMTTTQIKDLIYPEDYPSVMQKLDAHLNENAALQSLEFRLQRKDGSIGWIESRCAPIRVTGNELQIICVLRGIDAEKEARNATINTQAKLSAIFNHAQDAILLCDDDARCVDVNPAACEMLGYTRGELIGMTIWDFTPEGHRNAGKQTWEQFAETGKLSGQYLLLRKDGTQLIADFRAAYDILPGMHLSVLRDITEQIQLENTLLTNEARLRSVLESQTAYMVRINQEGKFTYANQRYLEHYGWMFPGEGLEGINVRATVLHEDLPAMTTTGLQALQEPGTPVQVVLRKPTEDGSHRWTLWELVALDGGKEVQCIGFDVTEQYDAQDQIKLQNQALEAAANAIAIIDRNSVVEWVNPAFTTLTGYSQEEAIGRRIGDLQRSQQQDPAFYKNLWETILAGESWSGLLVNRRKDGSTYTEEQMIAPVADQRGNITHFIAIKQDVSQRERNEKMRQDYERLKDQFAKERKQNTLVQRIISALSHDLRIPLSVIQSSKDKLERYYERMTESQRQQTMKAIDRQIKFTVNLLEDTVQLARGGLSEIDFRPMPVNLALLCQISVEESTTTTTQHDLVFKNLAGIEVVSVDELLVSRILVNLLSNAIKYSPDGGEIRLELDSQQEGWIILRVTDHGMGIREEDRLHIFDPFFRSDEVHEIYGTGLGLSIVSDCIERHQGRIHVESIWGEGSTFVIELPDHDPESA